MTYQQLHPHRYLAICVMLFMVLFAVQAYAQMATSLTVRVSENDGYDRIVFVVKGNANYELQSNAETHTVTMALSSPATADLSGYRDNPGRYVQDMAIIAPLSEPFAVEMALFPTSRVRNFKVGNRIIIDIYKPTDPKAMVDVHKKSVAEATKENILTPSVTEEKPTEETSQAGGNEGVQPTSDTVQSGDEESDLKPETVSAQTPNENGEQKVTMAVTEGEGEQVNETVDTINGVLAVDEEVSQMAPPEGFDALPVGAHAVTFTATEPFGMAAYERYGRVWFIIDNPDLTILPQVGGPEVESFDAMQRYRFPGGQAFSMEVPEGLAIRAEGGGLYWRFIIAQTLKTPDPAAVNKRIQGGEFGNGEVTIAMEYPGFLVRLPDPIVGDALAVVTVSRATMPQSAAMRFVDIDLLPSFAGAVIRPKSDGLRIQLDDAGSVIINRESGMTLSQSLIQDDSEFLEAQQAILPKDRVFNFGGWALSTRRSFEEKSAIINRDLAVLAGSNDQKTNKTDAAAMLIRAGKFYLANAMPQESLGYLRMARQLAPELRQSPEFASVRGAAYALSSYLRQARRDFNHPGLDEVDEVQIWRAYIAARYHQYERSYELLPLDLSLLQDYPLKIRSELAFAFSDVARQAGDSDMIRNLMDMVAENPKALSSDMAQGVQYFRGVSALTKNLPAEAYALMEVVEESENPYFGARASFTRITDQLERELIGPMEGLEQMERLRYAWRGDRMEADILETLGRLYVENGMEHKGLSTLRQAASQVTDRKSRDSITQTMQDSFVALFTGEMNNDMSALESVTIYEEFQELTPSGEVGDAVMAVLVDQLIEVDLLERAVRVLRTLANTRQEGEAAEQSTLRLASILLMDKKARAALDALEGMDKRFGEAVIQQPPPPPPAPIINEEPIDPSLTPMVKRAIQRQRDAAREAELLANPPEPVPVVEMEPQDPLHLKREVLKARALSDLNRHEEALAILKNIPDAQPDVLRLKADTAWRGGDWPMAAESFAGVLGAEDVGDALSITREHQAIILNYAIALSLSGNRAGLGMIRDDYQAAMASSPLYQSFQIITRPQRGGGLADRETLMSLVAEVDLFGQFLSTDN